MTIFYHPKYQEHRQAGSHPECPERLSSILNKLKEYNLDSDIRKPDTLADVATVAKIHEKTYIEMIESFGEGYLDPDTYHREETYEIAMLAVKGGQMAARYSYDSCKPSFALVRPPGHHSGADYSGGFCYFNNIAIAAQWLRDVKGCERVAIIDYDVHHGNGTEDIFFKRSDVLYVSTHQWGIYPGTGHYSSTGEDEGEGYTLNLPFLHNTGDSSFKLGYNELIKPVVTQFNPDMILVSLGTDGHYRDPIATLSLSSKGYYWLAKETINLAGELCDGRCVFLLEGGYDLEAIAEVVSKIIAEFEDRADEMILKYDHVTDTNQMGIDVVKAVKEIQEKYWKLK